MRPRIQNKDREQDFATMLFLSQTFKVKLSKVTSQRSCNKNLDHEIAASETNDADFSYKEVSDLSEATDDIQAESLAEQEINELDDYQTLVATT